MAYGPEKDGPSQELPKDMWANRTRSMRCITCMWWVEKVVEKSTLTSAMHALGRCRRHAPTLGGWPAVFGNDWCGDHKIDAERV